MRESTVVSLARRFLRAAAAAARGIVEVLEGALPAPQPVPVRVRRNPRG